MSKPRMKRTFKSAALVIAGNFLIAGAGFASSIQKLSESVGGVNKLVQGELGAAVVILGTLAGAVKAFNSGNLWLAAGIVGIGVLLGWHFEYMHTLFPTTRMN